MTTIAEGTPPPSSPSPPPPSVPGGGPPRPDEPDLLAERRAARRPADPGEHALLRRAEAAEATVKALEAHVLSLQQRLGEAEGDRRRTSELTERLERVEGALEAIRESHRQMAVTVGELRDVTVRLRALADREPAASPPVPPREEMADALAAAVERLRARAEQANAETSAGPAPARPKPHKHSMSLIGRLRRVRKQRREGR